MILSENRYPLFGIMLTPRGDIVWSGGHDEAVTPGRTLMTVSISHLAPIVALIAGVLILIMPRLLNYIVAIYLIIVGIIGLGIIK
jgi:hypothetical protein